MITQQHHKYALIHFKACQKLRVFLYYLHVRFRSVDSTGNRLDAKKKQKIKIKSNAFIPATRHKMYASIVAHSSFVDALPQFFVVVVVDVSC